MQRETRKALETADRNRLQAEGNRIEAEGNFAKARQAVDKYLENVTDNPRLKEADFHGLRKQLLETAVPFYEQFVAKQGNDPTLKSDQARVFEKLSRVYQLLGQDTEAESACERALDIREKLVLDSPGVQQHLINLSITATQRGDLLSDLGKKQAAEAAFRLALKVTERLEADFPGAPEHRLRVAAANTNLGILLDGVGTDLVFQRAFEVNKKLATDFPNVPAYQERLAESYNNLGSLSGRGGQSAEAVAAHRRALEILKNLARDFPGVPEYRDQEADSHEILGGHCQGAEAEAEYQRARTIREELVTQFPNVPEYRNCLAHANQLLGALFQEDGRAIQAESACQRALEIREHLCETFPSVPKYRDDTAFSHEMLAGLLEVIGQTTKAEKAARLSVDAREKLVLEFPGTASYKYGLGSSLNVLGHILHHQKQWSEARRVFEHAIVVTQIALSTAPTQRAYRRSLCSIYGNLCGTCMCLNDYPAAITFAIDIGRLNPDNAVERRIASTITAECIFLAARDVAVRPEKRIQIAITYCYQAPDLLAWYAQKSDKRPVTKASFFDSHPTFPDPPRLVPILETRDKFNRP